MTVPPHLSVLRRAPTDVSPLTPATTNQGQPLLIQWTPGGSDWESMEIKFMTGSNQHMTELETVATGVDGTSNGEGKLQWTAPEVSPNSAIYFFQFSHGGTNLTWTTRFAIADEDGNTTTPPYSKQPEGPAIPWGEGKLLSASNTTTTTSSSSSSTAATASSTSTAPASTTTSTPSSSTSTSTVSLPSTSVSTSSGSSSSSSSNSNGSQSSTTSSGNNQSSGASASFQSRFVAAAGLTLGAMALLI
ncbi:hypothetical protein IE53DRAFT_319792 [Violaceomyces palustris]|uniref:Uncharacterized protein n=1 Tax=Violaceomyces palustris TaxID=1673888 RepID=A0ACD0NR15_9BASI|nr:hypothetical protein IE53DRAFT_319792 [Violaceomyces palustris]